MKKQLSILTIFFASLFIMVGILAHTGLLENLAQLRVLIL